MALDKINPTGALTAAQNDMPTCSTRSRSVTSRNAEALPKHWISALFRKFQARYGHKWVSAMEGIEEAAVAEWAEVLAGLSGEQIAKGLATWREDWPPSAPEFERACGMTAEELGAPGVQQSLAIVCGPSGDKTMQARWLHPVVFHAARDPDLDLYALRRMPTAQAMKAWGSIYERYVSRLAGGEQFEFPQERALEDRSRKAVTPEERAASRVYGMSMVGLIRDEMRRVQSVAVTNWQRAHGMKAYV